MRSYYKEKFDADHYRNVKVKGLITISTQHADKTVSNSFIVENLFEWNALPA